MQRHWPLHFNGLNLNIKQRETLKATHPTIFCEKGTGKQCQCDNLRDVFIQWMYTHTLQPHTERFAIMFWKGKNSSKGLNFNKQWRKTTKGTHRTQHLLKKTMKKHSTPASNASSFNGCLCLTCFIVTKSIIDPVYRHDNEILQGLIDIDLKKSLQSGLRE